MALIEGEDPDTLQFSLNASLSAALADTGLRLTLINSGNGNQAQVYAFADNDNPLIDLEGSTPTVDANGVIYVSADNRVYALNQNSGAILPNWPFVAAGNIDSQAALSLDHDTLYVGSTTGILYAIGTAGQSDSGAGRWQTALGDEALAPPLVDELNTVNLGSLNHNFYSVDPDGDIRWTYIASDGIAEKAVPYGDYSLTFHSLDGQPHTIRAGVIGPHLLTWQSRDDSLLADYMHLADPDFAEYQADGWDVTEMFHVGRLFEGLLQRNPDEETLTFWTYALLKGATLEEVATAFLNSDSGRALYGELSNAGFLQALYLNVLGIDDAFAQADYDRLLAGLNNGTASRGATILFFTDHQDFAALIDQALLRIFEVFYGFCLEADCAFLADEDGDGLGDQWELEQFGNTTSQSGADDPDDDGLSNYEEYLAGTTPLGTIDPAPSPAALPLPDTAEVLASDRIGSLGGQFRVNETGSATYTIALYTPAGTAGVAPSLSLNYDSQRGNGMLGKGWSLGGLSAVGRCRQTLGQDGQAKPLSWNQQDRFCLDGQRLIVEAGYTYGAVGARYRTEVDSGARVISVGGRVGHPASFKVIRKDGSLSVYGADSLHGGTRLANQATRATAKGTFTWALSMFTDSVGNAIDYLYTDDDNGHRLAEVRYAYGSGTRAQARIELDYGDQARPDPIKGYMAGELQQITRRLTQIRVYNTEPDAGGENQVRRYELAYKPTGNDSNSNTISRLQSVTACVDSLCQPPTEFVWTERFDGFGRASYSTLESGTDLGIASYRVADINGDGKMDLVYFLLDVDGNDKDHRLQYALSNGDSLVTTEFAEGGVYIEFGNNSVPDLHILDYNGDGRNDVATKHRSEDYYNIFLAEPQGDNQWKLSRNPLQTETLGPGASFIDLNSDGLADVQYSDTYGSHFYYRELGRDPAEAVTSSHYYTFGPERELTWVDVPIEGVSRDQRNGLLSVGNADFNADGVVDAVGYSYQTTECENGSHGRRTCTGDLSVHALIREGASLRRYAQLWQGDIDLVFNDSILESDESPLEDARSKLTQVIDINNDGLSDVLSENGYWLNTGETLVAHTFAEATSDQQFPVDYNRDGYLDVLWYDEQAHHLKAMIWNSANGDFDAAHRLAGTATGNRAFPLFADTNGDGWQDYLYIRSQGDNSQLAVQHALGENQPGDMITQILGGLGGVTDITYGSLTNSGHYARITIDTTTLTGEYCRLNICNDYVYDRLEVGDFYRRLNSDWDFPEGNHSLGKGDKPVLELMAPLYVVTDVYSSAPTAIDAAAKSGISYYYGEAKMQAAGRGLLGFEKLTTLDRQSGVKTTTTYRQDFPFIGYPLSTEVKTTGGDLLARSDNRWQLQGWSGAGAPPVAPYRPVLAESVEISYRTSTNRTDSEGLTVNEMPLRTVITEQRFDTYGNPEWVEVTTAGDGLTHTKTTENGYANKTLILHGESFSYRELGRLTRTEVTTERSDDVDSKNSLRTSSFTYYDSGTSAGLLRTEVIEPGSGELTHTARHEYNSLGNKFKVTQSGAGVEDRVSETIYDSYGRYADITQNGYGQITTEVLSRNALGQATAVADINGVVSTRVYGAFGAPVFEGNETGAWKQTLRSLCSTQRSFCPETGSVVTTTTQAGGGRAFVVSDVLGRTVREASVHFDGSWTYKDTEYDDRGRVTRTSEPYGAGAGPAFWTSMRYDLLGRMIETTLPGVNGLVKVDYEGLGNVITNPAGQRKTELKNVLDELVRVEDAIGGRVQYRYNAQGNLRYADSLDALGVVAGTVQMCYDRLGRKTAMLDPDKGGHLPDVSATCPSDTSRPQTGWWLYGYNPFGELIYQIDAKGQNSEMSYDKLGRMLTRTDYSRRGDATNQAFWSYNNGQSGNGLGALAGVADDLTGYSRLIRYDGFGRVDETTTNLGGDGDDNHFEKTTYDEYGRTFQVFDAAGKGAWQSNAVQYRYNEYGYLLEVSNALKANGLREAYYHVQSMDRRGNVTEALGGNGVTRMHRYDPATGRLKTITASSATGVNDVQDLEYDWDDIGNLLTRYDRSGDKNLVEHFTEYDKLNRLRRYYVEGQDEQRVDYDGLGNITFKTGVGEYRYGRECAVGFGVHALCETDDGSTTAYAYDANGNMLSDTRGRTLSYTPFDKPSVISKGGHTTRFKYAPDRSRFLRTDENRDGITTTRYIGSVEKITHPDGRQTVKRYLPGNVLVSIERDTGGNKLGASLRQYLYKDHLGSLDVITDVAGKVVQTMSFDAWGQRRSAVDWSRLDLSSRLDFDHNLTVRGFTGHEMLDEVGLIHMNGRVYDPRLGRFLQADPQVMFASDTQSYYRYSYVLYNPLRYTD
ncbi:MAG: SpvB/TcaC N-terminal domain-containing protein, partial [Exilibacterium sp.]